MSYPEPGATYRNRPKWLDDVMDDEGPDSKDDFKRDKTKLADEMRAEAAESTEKDD